MQKKSRFRKKQFFVENVFFCITITFLDFGYLLLPFAYLLLFV